MHEYAIFYRKATKMKFLRHTDALKNLLNECYHPAADFHQFPKQFSVFAGFSASGECVQSNFLQAVYDKSELKVIFTGLSSTVRTVKVILC